jgi:hypothetical protein
LKNVAPFDHFHVYFPGPWVLFNPIWKLIEVDVENLSLKKKNKETPDIHIPHQKKDA